MITSEKTSQHSVFLFLTISMRQILQYHKIYEYEQINKHQLDYLCCLSLYIEREAVADDIGISAVCRQFLKNMIHATKNRESVFMILLWSLPTVLSPTLLMMCTLEGIDCDK
jgi:hypothetical protein